MEKQFIQYPHVRNHEHHIELSGINFDSLNDVSDDIELEPIIIHNTLDD